MADPDTFKEPAQEVIVEMAVGALERERLTQSAPILGKSSPDSLTSEDKSEILYTRPQEREFVEQLLYILRSGNADTAEQLQRSFRVLLRKIKEAADAGKAGARGKEMSRQP